MDQKSETQKLKDALQNDIEYSDEYLRRAKNVVDAVPFVQARKREAETIIEVLRYLPDDVAEELSPKIMPYYLQNVERYHSVVPMLPTIDHNHLSITSTSGTADYFYSATLQTIHHDPNAEWIGRVTIAFENLAETEAIKYTLPIKIERISPNLKDLYLSADDSYQKSFSNIVGLDQAAIRMRDFLQKLWGELADLARRQCSDEIGNKRLEFNSQKNRNEVSQCIAINGEAEQFVMHLENLYDLHQLLSPISKNMQYQDIDNLRRLYTQWILQLNDLSSIIELSG